MIAPEQFVHVLFSDGIPITNQHKLYIHANVRKGRAQDKIDLLVETLKTKCAENSRIPTEKVYVNLLEINAKWIMEGGHVMPDPGEEDEWMAKVTKALEERENNPLANTKPMKVTPEKNEKVAQMVFPPSTRSISTALKKRAQQKQN